MAISIVYKCVKSGQVIAQGLATGTRRGNYHVLALKDGVQGFCLVAVKIRYAQRFKTCLQVGVEGFIKLLEDCALMRNPFYMDNLLAVVSQADKVVQKGSGIHLEWS
jgi:hypothetical protein